MPFTLLLELTAVVTAGVLTSIIHLKIIENSFYKDKKEVGSLKIDVLHSNIQ